MMRKENGSGDPIRDALTQALIREAVSVGAVLVMIWALQHQAMIRHWTWKARRLISKNDKSDHERAMREAQRDISRMEHGEA